MFVSEATSTYKQRVIFAPRMFLYMHTILYKCAHLLPTALTVQGPNVMFGQIAIGPPGSGKSTFCFGMYQFLSAIGRKCCVVNLDPANENQPYDECALDIRDFIKLETVMNDYNLGPNGALMFSLESLNSVALKPFIAAIEKLAKEGNYFLFDCPGQVELFTHQNSLQKLFESLTKTLDARLCVVSLIDSIYITSPSLYISILLLSLRSMLQMALPQVNVLSKIDKLKEYGSLPMRLDYYTEVQNLRYLTPHLTREFKDPMSRNFVRLTQMIGDLVEDYDLVGFEVLAVENKKSMIQLLAVIDKANGYVYGSSEIGGDLLWRQFTLNRVLDQEEPEVHERWIESKEQYDLNENAEEAEGSESRNRYAEDIES